MNNNNTKNKNKSTRKGLRKGQDNPYNRTQIVKPIVQERIIKRFMSEISAMYPEQFTQDALLRIADLKLSWLLNWFEQNPVGKPDKLEMDTATKKAVVLYYRTEGELNLQLAGANARVRPMTVYSWKQQDPWFESMLYFAIEELASTVESKLYKGAVEDEEFSKQKLFLQANSPKYAGANNVNVTSKGEVSHKVNPVELQQLIDKLLGEPDERTEKTQQILANSAGDAELPNIDARKNQSSE